MQRRPRSTALAAAAGCMVASIATAGHAQSVGNFRLGGSVATGFSSDPYLDDQDEGTSAYGRLSVRPSYVLQDGVGSTAVSGDYQRTFYTGDRGNSSSYGANASHQRRLGEYTSGSIGVSYHSSILGEFASRPLLPAPIVPDDEEPAAGELPDQAEPPTDPLDGIDPELIGRRGRSSTLSVNGGISTRLNARDSLDLGVTASQATYKSSSAADHRMFGFSSSYSHALDSGSRVGFQLGFNRTDYGSDGTDATTIRPLLTYGRQLSPAISLDVALGAMFVDSEGQSNDPAISGNVRACHSTTVDSLCVSLNRDATSSGLGAVRKRLAASLSYSYRIGPSDSIQTSVTYSRSSAFRDTDDLPDGLGRGSTEYLSTGLSWSRRLNAWMSAGASLSARKTMYALQEDRRDFNGQLYISFSLERLR